MKPKVDLFENECPSEYCTLRQSTWTPDSQKREKLASMYSRCHQWLDKNWLERFLYKEFHQRAWELLIADTLRSLGFEFYKKPKDEGPDFVGFLNGTKVTVECLTYSPGSDGNPLSVPRSTDRYEESIKALGHRDGDGYPSSLHWHAVSLRVANAFREKLGQLQKHQEAGLVSETHLIAVGNGGVRPIVLHDNLPTYDQVWRLFLPFKTTGTFSLDTGEQGIVRETDTPKGQWSVEKPFLMNGAESVAGVLFGTTLFSVGHTPWEDTLYWVRNPKANQTFNVPKNSVLVSLVDG